LPGRKIISFMLFVAAVAAVSAFGSLFLPGEWYAALRKPAWNPPSRVFAPVWTALYLLMAVAAWMVWLRDHAQVRRALRWWVIQLLLNGAWSWLFFGLHRPGWALAEMSLLVVAIAITIGLFRRARPVAALLMVPYLAWVLFAWALNFSIWRLNGGGPATILG